MQSSVGYDRLSNLTILQWFLRYSRAAFGHLRWLKCNLQEILLKSCRKFCLAVSADSRPRPHYFRNALMLHLIAEVDRFGGNGRR